MNDEACGTANGRRTTDDTDDTDEETNRTFLSVLSVVKWLNGSECRGDGGTTTDYTDDTDGETNRALLSVISVLSVVFVPAYFTASSAVPDGMSLLLAHASITEVILEASTTKPFLESRAQTSHMVGP